MLDYQNLNYTALSDKTVSRKHFNEDQLALSGIKNNFSQTIMAVTLLMLLMLWGAPMAVGRKPIAVVVTAFVVTTIFAVPAFIIQISMNRQKYRLLKFALDNNALYFAAKQSPPSGPIMFDIGDFRYQTETIIFPGGATLAKYEYSFQRKSTKDPSSFSRGGILSFLFPHKITNLSDNGSRPHRFNFMEVKLPRAVLHLFINSKKNAVNPNTSNYKVQKLKLEGDFGECFEVLAPPDYHIDALQILTPNVMAAMMDYGQKYDFELIDDNLYIYQTGGTPMDSAEAMQQFLTAVATIATQFGKQAKTYSDVRAGSVASGSVAYEGARFERRDIVWTGVVVAMMMIFFILYLVFSFMIR
ncbi:MAG: hypothetical protein LBQ11_00455 [Candidatus Nomurabacteria bacterium]|jgi:hypothetical protein|nr:hypothetical protein [Candidatus Nomurabacteria bacterium]